MSAELPRAARQASRWGVPAASSMHRNKEAVGAGAAAPHSKEDASMTEDRRRCGWGAVLAAVTLFATLLLTVPPGPGLA